MKKQTEHLNSDRFSNMINILFGLVLIITAFTIGKIIFGDENEFFVDWWVTITILGVTFMPLSMLVFSEFTDLGWMFSKVIGIAVSGWLIWYLSSIKLLKFTRSGCIAVVVVCLILNLVLLFFKRKDFAKKANGAKISHIFIVEGIFLCMFVFWLYLKGFNPKAYGTTEKLMDYGFMQSMFKSEYMPPEDLWLAGKDLNYYYVGQFIATYLSKLSNVGVSYGYNLMLMMVAALAFSLPASIVFNVACGVGKENHRDNSAAFQLFTYLAAILSGTAVCFAGNLHYLVYAKFIPWLRVMLGLDKMAEASGYTFPGYWFPNATRYIGYNPDTADKTIHEFPVYSFVLGDLHAHVINIIFVLTVIAILYAYLQFRKSRMDDARQKGIFDTTGNGMVFGIPNFYKEVFNPCIVLTGFFIGLFHTTNFWDFPIYFVVAGAVILFSNCVIYNFSFNTVKLTFFHAVVVLVVAKISCLPFTLKFHQIASTIKYSINRTPLYQLAILWGLPVVVTLVLLGVLINNLKEKELFGAESKSLIGKKSNLFRFIGNLENSDLFILTLGLCAIGLVIIPEVIYVKDIYSGDYKRANTMFKLTYQAFIMFGMVMGYTISKFIMFARKNKRRVFAIVAGLLLIMSVGYFKNATFAWFGKWTSTEDYKTLASGNYLKDINMDDYNASNWINKNIEGRPVMLEVNGDSYTDYCRISVQTGLPTLLGWKTHEWLWQSDDTGQLPQIVIDRENDIHTIYTTDDKHILEDLISEYNIEYIYVGDLEKDKYEEPVNHSLLQSLGEVIYPSNFDISDSDEKTYIIKIK